jgi:hypothetical protein
MAKEYIFRLAKAHDHMSEALRYYNALNALGIAGTIRPGWKPVRVDGDLIAQVNELLASTKGYVEMSMSPSYEMMSILTLPPLEKANDS